MRNKKIELCHVLLGLLIGLLCTVLAQGTRAENTLSWAGVTDIGARFSVYSYGRAPYNRAAPFLTLPERQQFSDGAETFAQTFLTVEEMPEGNDLPIMDHFNTRSCATCHVLDGRGIAHSDDLAATGFSVLRTADGTVPVSREHGKAGATDPLLTKIEWEIVKRISLNDGEVVTLVAPLVRVDGVVRAADLRNAPGVYGLGLLEAIPADAIRAHAAATPFADVGVKGRLPLSSTDPLRVGRFGWKASFATLDAQVESAMGVEMGLGTDPVRPAKDQTGPFQTAHAKLTNYVRYLAVPARRDASAPTHVAGAHVFEDTGCAMCHKPRWDIKTPANAEPNFAGQSIYPFTDMLLHDMGDALSGVPDDPLGRYWRTPPLWGIGVQEEMTRGVGFLHDGRARNLHEAILWHGGEASYAVGRFKDLAPQDRANLMAFLASL